MRTSVSSEEMAICRRCFRLYDGASVDGPQQRCMCDRGGEPRWPGYDFNERVELCRCCHRELLSSGSKFSVWFCGPCKRLVVRSNDEIRRWLIPIGRHSFMARTYEGPPAVLALSGPTIQRVIEGDSEAKLQLEAFRQGVVRVSSSTQRLYGWSGRTLLRLFGELGFPEDRDVDLQAFLRRLRSASVRDRLLGRGALFRSLRDDMLEQEDRDARR